MTESHVCCQLIVFEVEFELVKETERNDGIGDYDTKQ